MKQCLVCWVVLSLALSGCGGPGRLPNLVPVSGVITLDDDPLPRGSVGFIPVEPRSGQPASGLIKDGQFKLETSASSPGVVAGEYEVVIISTEEADAPSVTDSDQGPADPVKMAIMMDPKNAPKPPKSLIPAKYNSSKTSGLKVSVKPGMKPLQLELSSEK